MRLSKSTFNSSLQNIKDKQIDFVTRDLYKMCGIFQESSGIFQYNFLIQKVISKIEKIIKYHMEKNIGAFEIKVPTIQDLDLWKNSQREQTYGPEMFQLKDRHNRLMCLAPTGEPYITNLIKKTIQSYKQLPFVLYQISDKYRDEMRPRYGLIRGRQFIMKDSYSICATHSQQKKIYLQHYNTYLDIFKDIGLKDIILVPSDTGQIGGKSSHQFAVYSEFGEDKVYYHKEIMPFAKKTKNFKEIEFNKNNPQVAEKKEHYPDFHMNYEKNVLEIAHIYYLDNVYSKPLEAIFIDKDNRKKNFIMGSFGIGISRIIHHLYEKYTYLPLNVSPFNIHIISNRSEDLKHEKFYKKLRKNFEVLFDDRDKSLKDKIADGDLIKIPFRIILKKDSILFLDFINKIEKNYSYEAEKDLINYLRKNIKKSF